MRGSDRARPSEMVLMALVARKYYIRGESKRDIADQLEISRFRVARLLEKAKATGIVRIEVGLPGDIDAGLSAELRESLALRHAIVIDAPEEPELALLHRLGQTVGRLLSEIVGDDDTLGLASARSLMGLSDQLRSFARCRVVQLTGALSRPDAWDVIEGIRGLTRAGGGPAYVFYAPIIAPDSTVREGYRRQPDVARAFSMFPEITTAVVGVGAWRPGLSTIYDAVSAEERRASTDAGVFVETAGLLLDRDGNQVKIPLGERLMAPSIEEIRRIPTVISAVFGERKAAAVRAAVRGGVVNALVTHRALAEKILNE